MNLEFGRVSFTISTTAKPINTVFIRTPENTWSKLTPFHRIVRRRPKQLRSFGKPSMNGKTVPGSRKEKGRLVNQNHTPFMKCIMVHGRERPKNKIDH